MQDYINLINFLKENDESVRKDLETLKFGTRITGNLFDEDFNPIDDSPIEELLFVREVDRGQCSSRLCITNKGNADIYHIIGNNLDYHHIMMYCNNNIEQTIVRFDMYGHFINEYGEVEFQLDYTKPLHEQKSEVYKALLDYFIGLQ